MKLSQKRPEVSHYEGRLSQDCVGELFGAPRVGEFSHPFPRGARSPNNSPTQALSRPRA